jgi:hypothetical protein
MRTMHLPFRMILFLALVVGSSFAQQKIKLGDNAALRYWDAFGEMQDSEISAEQVKELNAILDGTAPYDDAKYKELVAKNRAALETMAHGTSRANCDWGIDYSRGEDEPIDYARKALALGRLNVLYAFHLQIAGDAGGSVRALVAGLRFSRDVANGGTLFAALVGKHLLAAHLRAIIFTAHAAGISPVQKSDLQKAVAQLGANPLDWLGATKRDLELLRPRTTADPEAASALTRIVTLYVAALNDPPALTTLKQTIAGAPHQIAHLIPSPERVLEEKQDLTSKIQGATSSLR